MDVGAVGSVNVAVVAAPDSVALLFPLVVSSAPGSPVSGVGFTAFAVVIEMVGLAGGCRSRGSRARNTLGPLCGQRRGLGR